ncbi:hypothetical protein BpHYR1_035957 [Brachionus plicatilis]|uniref:Uncharacterized protein n=1 Tax=Brachionus plicatilis TaxID=10195 RepID=A0A3M7Q8R3_BRAPC|nr:hypothetical protein BpHYR1_035957 [Brachionus plicatilis]
MNYMRNKKFELFCLNFDSIKTHELKFLPFSYFLGDLFKNKTFRITNFSSEFKIMLITRLYLTNNAIFFYGRCLVHLAGYYRQNEEAGCNPANY